jgi:hypothetical protein
VTSKDRSKFSVNASQWFNGTVIRYSIDCADCNTTIKLRNNLEKINYILNATGYNDVVTHGNKSFVQQNNHLVVMGEISGNVTDVVSFYITDPSVVCTKVVVHESGLFTVSACGNGLSV